MISENSIEEVIVELEAQPEKFEQEIKSILEEQEGVAAFILSEGFKLLQDDEYDLFTYIMLVIIKSFKKERKTRNILIETIETIEEKNWEQFSGMGSKPFKEKLDVIFEEYPQEELLAFVEDALQNDDDSTLSAVGREIIFVAEKTLIDAFHKTSD